MDLLRHLRFFVAVAEAQHFGQAATQLGMTQPPLSQGIRRLEAHLGVSLFDRNSRGVALTAAGGTLLEQAEDLLAAADRFALAATAAVPEQPVARIGIVPDLGRRATTVVSRVRLALDGRDVSVSVAPSEALIDRLRAGELDAAVVRHPSVVDGLASGEVVRLATWLLLPAEHEGDDAGEPSPVRLADLALPLALPPRRSHPAAHDLVVDTLRRHGHPGTTLAVASDEVEVAVAGGSAAALSVDRPREGAGVRVCRVQDDLLPLRLRVVAGSAQDPVREWAAALDQAVREAVGVD